MCTILAPLTLSSFWFSSLFSVPPAPIHTHVQACPHTHPRASTVLSLAFRAPLVPQSLLDLDCLSFDLTLMENISSFCCCCCCCWFSSVAFCLWWDFEYSELGVLASAVYCLLAPPVRIVCSRSLLPATGAWSQSHDPCHWLLPPITYNSGQVLVLMCFSVCLW